MDSLARCTTIDETFFKRVMALLILSAFFSASGLAITALRSIDGHAYLQRSSEFCCPITSWLP